MIKKKIRIWFELFLVCMLFLTGCGNAELVKEHINDPLAASGDVSYYASMDKDERSSLCDKQHIGVSGIVTDIGSYYLYLGKKSSDGLEIHCSFDEKIEGIVKGDSIIVDGVCDGAYSETIYLYGCRATLNSEDSAMDESAQTKEGTIKAPIASYAGEGKNYKDVATIFENAGFKVVLNPYEQKKDETLNEDGGVIIVAAGDQAIFEEGEELPADVEITISYCVISDLENADAKPNYSITEMTAIMYANTTANVRSGPNKNENKLGTLNKNDEVDVTGITDNGWYRIDYKGDAGFVKDNLLVEGKEENLSIVDDTNNVTQPKQEEPAVVVAPPVVETPVVETPVVETPPAAAGSAYVLNTNSYKFHHPGCKSVAKMAAHNRLDYNGTRDEIIAMGYSPCGNCHP